MSTSTYRFSVSLACVVILAQSITTRGATVRTVALTGQHAPGTVVSTFTDFHLPLLDNTGGTAFWATASGSQGIWSEGSGSLQLVARQGNQPPGTASGVQSNSFNGPTPHVVYENGKTAFIAFLTGSGVDNTNSHGIWSEGSGSLALVAREGNHAPGTPAGVNFDNLNSASLPNPAPRLNAAGHTAFFATLRGTGVNASNDEGIWSNTSGALTLVARAGGAAPGTPTGVNFSSLEQPDLNDAGQTAFLSALTGTGVTAANNEGIWAERSGALTLIARTGSQAPGAPSGFNFVDFRPPALNAAGHTAFHGIISTGPSVNEQGIWSEGSGSLALVALGGNPAPGTPSGVVFNQPGPPVLNASGHTAFAANLRGTGIGATNNSGIWSDGFGDLTLVAREGTHAPGTPSGVNFLTFNQPTLNANGQTAFWTILNGPGITTANDRGIWATSVTGRLKLIAREGDQLEVAPSDFRTITTLIFNVDTGNGDGRTSGFNDAGQLAFFATFTDGSRGVFVSDLVTVPEPNTLAMLGLLLAFVGLTARRR